VSTSLICINARHTEYVVADSLTTCNKFALLSPYNVHIEDWIQRSRQMEAIILTFREGAFTLSYQLETAPGHS
jgi:hypothetical protein